MDQPLRRGGCQPITSVVVLGRAEAGDGRTYEGQQALAVVK